jgi:regulator of sirC expression with transglutaminase-like and TPR domain
MIRAQLVRALTFSFKAMTRTLALELFKEMVSRPEDRIDLDLAALLIALDEYPNLNVRQYLKEIDGLAAKISSQMEFSAEARPIDAIEKINQHVFEHAGFRGNSEDYYDPRNSFLNEVIDRKTGIPITLSLLYMEVGKRLGLHFQGVGMPGHFIVKCLHQSLEIFVDPFNQGEILLEEGCKKKLKQIYGENFQFDPAYLNPVNKRQILSRMLNNLKQIYLHLEDFTKALRTIEKILLITPDAPEEVRDHGTVQYKLGNFGQALKDWTHYLELQPLASDAQEIRSHLAIIGRMLAFRN